MSTVSILNYSMYSSIDTSMNKKKFTQGQDNRLSIQLAW